MLGSEALGTHRRGARGIGPGAEPVLGQKLQQAVHIPVRRAIGNKWLRPVMAMEGRSGPGGAAPFHKEIALRFFPRAPFTQTHKVYLAKPTLPCC